MALLLAALSCGKELAVDGDVTGGGLTAEGHDRLCMTSAVMKTSLNDQMEVVWGKDDRIRVMGQSNAKGESYHIKELSVFCIHVTAGHDASAAVTVSDVRRIVVELVAAQSEVGHVCRQRDDYSLTS